MGYPYVHIRALAAPNLALIAFVAFLNAGEEQEDKVEIGDLCHVGFGNEKEVIGFHQGGITLQPIEDWARGAPAASIRKIRLSGNNRVTKKSLSKLYMKMARKFSRGKYRVFTKSCITFLYQVMPKFGVDLDTEVDKGLGFERIDKLYRLLSKRTAEECENCGSLRAYLRELKEILKSK